MPKLNQIIAVEKGVKSKAFAELSDAHHAVQKTGPLAGISRTYQPKDEEGEQLPPSRRGCRSRPRRSCARCPGR
ncbi:hypothetical protein Asp14428_74280 [Actinoplanes sp. NBRC 14428]|nr:hypothetical protein Asp14428_74280 [Actinoplanes sp. NBRC 14428]